MPERPQNLSPVHSGDGGGVARGGEGSADAAGDLQLLWQAALRDGQHEPVQQPLREPIQALPGDGNRSNMSSPRTPRSRIDPNQVPRPPSSTGKDSDGKEFRTSSLATTPIPQAASSYRIIDDGNCSPRFMRMSINQLPATKELAQKLALPIAVVIQPLAQLPPDEVQVPFVVDHVQGPVRCRRCRAYINCHVQFIDGGRHWTCNMCGMNNGVESDYFCTLDAQGRRRDAADRPELSLGSVDFAASQEYCDRPAMAPAFMFAIDVSANAVQGGLLHASVAAIRECVEQLSRAEGVDSRAMLGILTFDTQLHFFNLSTDADSDIPGMCVVSDVDDPFVPTPLCFVNVREKKHNIFKLLDALPDLFKDNQNGEAAVGAALRTATQALEPNGGKVVCMFGSPPTLGVGKLSRHDDFQAVGTDREKRLHTPDNNFYSELATHCCKVQVAVDLHVCTSLYTDLVSMGVLCKNTGGQIHYLPKFGQDGGGSSGKLYHEILRATLRFTGYEAVLRVRCSQGFAVVDYYGCFHKTPEGDIEFPVIDSDKALAVTIKAEADVSGGVSHGAIQCALLYTAQDGSRRIRVHTLAAPITGSISTIFKSADLDSLMNFTAKQAVVHLLAHSLESARQNLIVNAVQILYIYRRHCASNPAPGQLILPESLKLLPLYTLGMMKNKALVSDTAIIKTDERAYLMQRLLTLSASETSTFIYPRMFALHQLGPEHGTPDNKGGVYLPACISLTAEKLDSEGAYLLENGEVMILWLGKQLPQSFLEQIFGVHALAENTAGGLQLQPRENALSRKVCAMIEFIRSHRPSYPVVQIVQQRDVAESNMFAYMVEDRCGSIVSYVDFLCHVHSKIQAKLTDRAGSRDHVGAVASSATCAVRYRPSSRDHTGAVLLCPLSRAQQVAAHVSGGCCYFPCHEHSKSQLT
eukprot:CAMPEP_0206231294 /NCGR_PEP_ID=MMETSP0047_2-20121206/10758_1 /ASSEMBLY_ACC=CAM_ASM_000192 /TAXON_ID=195065 /ORGANISM="Chroomonas mesostigmatica_cf, Strain CCMP1168" /LENGTH=922 /DNA_ID=CAMNT_0053654859 /DNA_START=29 /DNA_END=2799 /DNA_ORIENTATION=-